ncbi:alkylation response protein AidB-like acyl-CoA dehydrogenase [Micromonospora pisi]|uniref:Alkylation response protein AidB-like acyl-CoA dehydrogenase n=1 Tax=Micromonospora pisi TaxID=589240 RepID=A0A495JHJ8_9ACTN|nr:acyl-CoA dehydrogenase family protein [Micromonospora pisi]RKR88476.1 alkylation response protein AidB-like acyl-CoA dehydrogenase [Micromonospora pisi]
MSLALIDQVRALSVRIRALAPGIERDRGLPEDLVDDLTGLGLFRLAAPNAAGGVEADPLTMFEVFEELGRADGSVGWCTMIGAATGATLGYLDEPVAAKLLADPRFLIAGVAAPSGRATMVPGGYRVRGRWSFASASRHSTHLVGGCVVFDGDTPAPGPGGMPQVRHVIMPAADLSIHDNWDVVGLAGTGSHDIEAVDVFVPDAYSFSLFGPPRQDRPLYRFPVFGLLAFGIGAVALGIARAALDEFARLAGEKRDPLTGQPVAGKPMIQAGLAEAEAILGAGRAYLLGEIADCWRRVSAGEVVPVEQRARLRLAIAYATRSAAHAVDLVYHAGGGASIRASSPLQRCFRDVHVATQHALVSQDVRELVGAVLLDQPVVTVRL